MHPDLRQEIHWQTNVPKQISANISKQCPKSKKEMLPKRKQALGFAAWVRKQTGDEMGIYKCPDCNHWHITTK